MVNVFPPDRPDALADACNRAPERDPSIADDWRYVTPDSQENIDAAIKWLLVEAKPAIEGSGGNNMLTATAAMMHSYGLTDDTALELIKEFYNPRCIPPWSEDEIENFERTIRSGYSSSSSRPGNMTAEYQARKVSELFKPVIVKTVEGLAEQLHGYTIRDELAVDTMKSPPWLIKDFLPAQSYCIIYGNENDGKTFCALDIALTLAYEPKDVFKQTTIWGSQIGERGPVLFMAGEGVHGIKKRRAAWKHFHGFEGESGRFFMLDPVPHVTEDPAILEVLIGLIKRRAPAYKLLVLDTITTATAGESQSKDEIASGFGNMARSFSRALGCTVLALHHTNDAGTMRGSRMFRGDADTIIRLDNDKHLVTLTMEKQKEAERWKEPKCLRLTNVQFSKNENSLVAMPTNEKAPEPTVKLKKGGSGRDRAQAHKAALKQADDIVKQVTSSTPGKEYSNSLLSEVMAAREDMDIPSSQLRKSILVELRETIGTTTNQLYDPYKKIYVWRKSHDYP